MEITCTDKDRVSTTTVDVTIRIPESAIGDLVTEAERRLGGVDGIHAVSDTDIRGINPRMSATLVTMVATIEYTITTDKLRNRIADTAYIDVVGQLTESHL